MSGGSSARRTVESRSVGDGDQHDIETPDSIQRRFDIEDVEADVRAGISVMSMPVAGLLNPFTGAPTIGPLAILLDAAGGMSNHYRRSRHQWTVSSELALELSPDAISVILAHPRRPVLAAGRPLGPTGVSALSVSTLTCGDTVIGGGTVRSYFIPADGVLSEPPPDTVVRGPDITLSELMAVEVRPAEGEAKVLAQLADPGLNNDLGIVNGGVAAAGLELAASAAINSTQHEFFRTASVRVNFLRPFVAGPSTSYRGTPMRIGRGTAIGDAEAVGDDGRVAICARITAYR